MEVESCVPPGFRFHPTEEELVGYYLQRKVSSLKIDLQVIVDIDLYRIEPWDIQDRCKLGYEEQNEWYFFSHKDRKYPTGTRTNRATAAGFWKATGRDKAVLSKERTIGMRKTLVFYKGRAPNGSKTDWIMHEYRLQTSEHAPTQEEGWVVCRAFKKPTPNQKQGYESWSNNSFYYRNNNNFRPSSSSSFQDHPAFNAMHAAALIHQNESKSFHYQLPSCSSLGHQQSLVSNHLGFDSPLIELPQLDSPTLSTSIATNEEQERDKSSNQGNSQCSDWKLLDNSPFSYPNLPLIHCEDELDPQSHMSHLLGCFPDL